tara:strand:- start:2705 stop:2980 length:276 start_codon:yes stop_codon:yes gene_type:complete
MNISKRDVLDKTFCYNYFYCSLINISIGILSILKFKFLIFLFITYKLFKYYTAKDKIQKKNYFIDIIEFSIGLILGYGIPLLFNNFKTRFS